jgi:transposase-like protein
MAVSYFSAPHFHDEQAAIDFVEARVWAKGRPCPHCGVIGESGRLQGKSTRLGLWKCYACRKPFTVKIGTIFEESHFPMHMWLQAIFLVASSKKGISTNQLQRTLGCSMKTAWFLSHRIRLAMAGDDPTLMGGGGKPVEADETYYGRKPRRDIRRGYGHKEIVFSLVERGGHVRSTHITGKTFSGIKRALRKNVSAEARLMTDDARLYRKIALRFAEHQAVNHSAGEYVRGDAHTNTVEGYFSVFKRGMTGIYQHCDWKHLHRYLAEFDFRYNNRAALKVDDVQRADNLLRNVTGKRLTYETAGEEKASSLI